jgi:hypothetical protein
MPSAAGPQAGSGSQYGTPSWPQPAGPAGPGGTPPGATRQATTWQQQPSPAGSWPGGGQPSGPGGASYPSGGNPLAQYAPGRRRPTKAELPTPVLTAARLMYLGAVVTALNILFGNQAKSDYTATANKDNNAAAVHRAREASLPVARVGERATARAAANAATAAARHANVMAGEIALVVGLGGLIGVVCWLVVAGACRRGRGWTRPVGTLLLGLDTVGLLIVLLGTHNDPGVQATTVIIWIIGLAATILLWGRQAGDFFASYRR